MPTHTHTHIFITGTLTGGARGPASSSILLKFAELTEKRGELQKREAALEAMKKEAAQLKKVCSVFNVFFLCMYVCMYEKACCF